MFLKSLGQQKWNSGKSCALLSGTSVEDMFSQPVCSKMRRSLMLHAGAELLPSAGAKCIFIVYVPRIWSKCLVYYLFAFKFNFFQKIIIRGFFCANEFYSFAGRFNQIAHQEGVVLVLNLLLCKLIKKIYFIYYI